MSSLSQFNVSPDLVGAKTEPPPANDTASSGLNGRLQRIAQRVTALIAQIPAALGQGTKAQSMSVTLASNDDLISAVGAKTDAKNTATDTTSVSAMSVWKQISASIQTLATTGQQLKSASRSMTLASDDDLLIKIGEVQASPTANTVLDRLKAITTALGSSIGLASQGFAATVTVTRPGDTAAYLANDVIGASTGSTAALQFNNIGPAAGGEVMITSASLEIDSTGIISGETGYELKLYSVTPPSALGDNASWDLPSGDRASYLGKISLGAVADLGSTLMVEADAINKQITLAGTSLFAYLVTLGPYTPTSGRVYVVKLHTARV
jgi:hypothetical protein